MQNEIKKSFPLCCAGNQDSERHACAYDVIAASSDLRGQSGLSSTARIEHSPFIQYFDTLLLLFESFDRQRFILFLLSCRPPEKKMLLVPYLLASLLIHQKKLTKNIN
jgi:hypothetical protein